MATGQGPPSHEAPLPPFDVENLVAVVAGGGTGIGKAATHALVAAGAKTVYILGRRHEALLECRSSAARPEAVTALVCDVTSKESLAAAASRVRSDFGYCDVVMANAGVPEIPRQALDRSSVRSIQQALWAADAAAYEGLFRVNALGAFFTAVAFLDLLDEGNRRGAVVQKSQVIVTSSVTAYTAASFGAFGYPATKAALGIMAKQLEGLLLPFKIRVNVVVAGIYLSEMTRETLSLLGPADPCQEGAIDKTYIPLERVGSRHDIAGLILFLASRAGAYVSGAELVTDGGMLAVPPPWAVPAPPPGAAIP